MIEIIIALVTLIIALICWIIESQSKHKSGGKDHDMQRDRNPLRIAEILFATTNARWAEARHPLHDDYIAAIQSLEGKVFPVPVTLDDIPGRLKYIEGAHLPASSIHVGQRKLGLSEIQFLTTHTEPGAPIMVVYAGAAPSNKGKSLVELFPHVKFLMVDPNPFDILQFEPHYIDKAASPADQLREFDTVDNPICIINDYFTADLARALDGRKFLFISDIRTNLEGKGPDVLDIIWNSAQQYVWITLSHPIMSMLKYRQPFYNDKEIGELDAEIEKYPFTKPDFELAKSLGVDFVANAKKHKLIYFKGKIHIQAYAPISSTETRLVTDGMALVDMGELSEYEDKFFYYNKVQRPFGVHHNPSANRDLHLDKCGDCALEAHIWREYIAKHKPREVSVAYYVKMMTDLLSSGDYERTLLKDRHGFHFGPMSEAAARGLVRWWEAKGSELGSKRGYKPPKGKKVVN